MVASVTAGRKAFALALGAPPDLATLDTFCESNGFGRLLRDQARRLHARLGA